MEQGYRKGGRPFSKPYVFPFFTARAESSLKESFIFLKSFFSHYEEYAPVPEFGFCVVVRGNLYGASIFLPLAVSSGGATFDELRIGVYIKVYLDQLSLMSRDCTLFVDMAILVSAGPKGADGHYRS